MSNALSTDAVLDDFRHYLEATDFAHLTAQQPEDLTTLFTDLAGLKNEVKSQSRQFKATLDSLEQAVSTLTEDNQALRQALEDVKTQATRHAETIERSVLAEILDFYDRLDEAYQALSHYRPVNRLFRHSKPQDVTFIERLKQGQEITRRRFLEWLQKNHITPIDCLGQPFDANTMRTLAVGHDAKQDHGTVLAVMRSGFRHHDQVLRLAEVKVNKL
ncbi:MAG: nucleotide exchange factor GrpE [Methylococcales bacterium]|nr:nucleotide exchange factor GrpE [Methylococcales bacterium]